jgi:predicted nuclease of predicted toxin-antitoxin system
VKFKVDENLPHELVADIRAAGHDADSVPDEGLKGALDPVLMQHVQQDGRALITLDKGIADIRSYPPSQYFGLVLFRPKTGGRGEVLDFVRRNLPAVFQLSLRGRLVVVSETGIRMR